MARTNFLDEDIEDASVHVGYRDGVLEDKELLEFVEKHVTSKEGHPEYYRTIMQDMFSNTNLGMRSFTLTDVFQLTAAACFSLQHDVGREPGHRRLRCCFHRIWSLQHTL